MHILAVIMLHQHKFCVYKGKRKLKLLITCKNFEFFWGALSVFILLHKYVFRKCGKKFTVGGGGGGGLERVGQVTVNTAFFPLLSSLHEETGSFTTHRVASEDRSDCTCDWANLRFTGRTRHLVGFDVHWLI